jgi:DNA replication and repair protein RecF
MMWLEKLTLQNFRNYENAQITFCKKTNMIQGENAQGKTNILEALSLLSTGRSFRTPHLSDAIYHGKSSFFIEVHFFKEGVEQSLSLYFDKTTKKILHNKTIYPSFVSILGIVPSVFIVPEDISLIIGAPAERRRFLDIHIAQIDPLYVYHLGRYYKAMKQRNLLLKQQNESSLSSWEHIMAQAAAYLISARIRHLQQLLPDAERFMNVLSKSKDSLTASYHSSLSKPTEGADLASAYLHLWQQSRKRDLLLKSTLLGPHRDDIMFSINQKEAKYFGSEGQKRCCITALYLSIHMSMEKTLSTAPILGIDDFGAHLDPSRSLALLEHITTSGQTFLTSPTPFALHHDEGKHFYISSGHISEDRALYVANMHDL